jgi:hypothetical protein
VEHTRSGNGGQFEVTIYRCETSLVIGVQDNGSDKTPAPATLDPDSETGRGLGLVELIADRWEVCGDQRGRISPPLDHWRICGETVLACQAAIATAITRSSWISCATS